MRNVYPFREEATLVNRIGTALAYLVLGFVISSYPVDNLLLMFMLLALVYWVCIGRRKHEVKYFVRHHVLQSLILMVCLSMMLWLLVALIGLISTLPFMGQLAEWLFYALFQWNVFAWEGSTISMSVKNVFIMSLSGVAAFYCLRGRYVELPWVTDAVRSWM